MKKWLSILLASVLTLSLLPTAAFAVDVSDPSQSVKVNIDVTYQQDSAREMLDYINNFRTGKDNADNQPPTYKGEDGSTIVCENLQPLVYDYELEKYAMQRAAEIALAFSHTRPNEQPLKTSAECIAAGPDTAGDTFHVFREDDQPYSGQGHRRIMLDAELKAIGIGHVVYEGRHYWVQSYSRSVQNQTPATAVNGQQSVGVTINNNQFAKDPAPTLDKISTDPLQLYVGDTAAAPTTKLHFKLKEADLNAEVTAQIDIPWTSPDTSIVTVENNQIRAVAPGEVQLTGTVMGETFTYTVKVLERASYTEVPEVKATCETAGTAAHYKDANGKLYLKDEHGTMVETTEDQLVLPALGHKWGDVAYTWTADNSACSAKRVCKNDSAHVEEAKATVTEEKTKVPTYEAEGESVFTATFTESWATEQVKTVTVPKLVLTFTEVPEVKATCTTDGNIAHFKGSDGKLYVNGPDGNKVVTTAEDVVIPALGHNWGDVAYTWTSDNSACSAKRVCKNDSAHVEEAKATVTEEETKAPTYEADGENTFTATFTESWATEQVKTVTVPKQEVTYTEVAKKDATCETAGNIAHFKGSDGKLYVNGPDGSKVVTTAEDVVIPALGHNWGDVAYTWGEDNSACSAKRVCKNDSAHVEEANATVTKVETTPPTYEADGVNTFTATFTESWATEQVKTVTVPKLVLTFTEVAKKDATCETAGNIAHFKGSDGKLYVNGPDGNKVVTTAEDVVIPALGHNWGDVAYTWTSDNSACSAKRICKNDSAHVEEANATVTEEETKAPTYEAEGESVFTATFTASWATKQVKTVTVPKLVLTFTEVPEVKATCETAGNIAHFKGSDGKLYVNDPDGKKVETTEDQVVVPALGHNWGDVAYTWTTDNSACSAKRICKNDSAHVEEAKATVTEEKTKVPTYEAEGESIFTATFTESWATEQVKTVTVPKLEVTYTAVPEVKATCTTDGTAAYFKGSDGKIYVNDANGNKVVTTADKLVLKATGHDWGAASYTWSNNNNACTAKRVCKHDSAHVEELKGTVKNSMTKTPTYDAEGEITYTAEFAQNWAAKQVKTVPVAKLTVTYTEVPEVKATCTTTGVAAHFKGSDGKLYVNDAKGNKVQVTEKDLVTAVRHDGVLVKGKAATIEETGLKDYYHCKACGKNFADKNCTKEITTNLDTWRVIPKLDPSKPPKTGDSSNLLLWTALLALSATSVGFVVRYKKKYSEE